MSAFFRATALTKTYRAVAGQSVRAIDDVSFEISRGEFITIVGPSGSGKTTLLQMLAGIESPNFGEIERSPELPTPRIGMVFQANTVFPWRTIECNLAYALEMKKIGRAERRVEAARLCDLLGLEPSLFLDKYPRELSGGELRRVAIGMALACGADALLFDEPTSQLDYFSRIQVQQVAQAVWAKKSLTAIYVTHDLDEAILLADRIFVLDRGHLKDTITIDLPRPRSEMLVSTPAFGAYRQHLLSHFGVAGM